MPRGPRGFDPEGGYYHIYDRGNDRRRVFIDELDLQFFTGLAAKNFDRYDVKIYHHSLMPNHYHFVLETADGPALSKAAHAINLTYALNFKKRHGLSGHLWQGRFKDVRISSDAQLLACGIYVELNPVRAGLADDPADYRWSSHRYYSCGEKMPMITSNPLYSTLGADDEARRRTYMMLTEMWESKERPG